MYALEIEHLLFEAGLHDEALDRNGTRLTEASHIAFAASTKRHLGGVHLHPSAELHCFFLHPGSAAIRHLGGVCFPHLTELRGLFLHLGYLALHEKRPTKSSSWWCLANLIWRSFAGYCVRSNNHPLADALGIPVFPVVYPGLQLLLAWNLALAFVEAWQHGPTLRLANFEFEESRAPTNMLLDLGLTVY